MVRTRYHYQCSFIPDVDVPDVQPPFRKGKRDSCWIGVWSKRETEVTKALKNKLLRCYGIIPTEVSCTYGFETSYNSE